MKDLSRINASRRRLIKQASAASLTLSLPRTNISALTLAPPEKRVIFVYVPNGANPEYWMPKGCRDRFTLPQVSAPLEPVKQHCVFFDDVSLENAGHGASFRALGGLHGTDTVDVVLGKHLQDDADLANLFLISHTAYEHVSRCDMQGCSYIDSPTAFYRDFLHAHIPYVARALPAFDKSLNVDPDDVATSPYNFDRITNLNMELACLALHLNTTRAVTLMLGGTDGDMTAPESGIAAPLTYNQTVHAYNTPDAYNQFRAYLTRKLLYLIQLLEATPDRNGKSLLESTIVVQVADMGDGQQHSGERLPFMIAGGSDYVRTGQYLRGTKDISKVMDTVSAALGVPEALLGEGPMEGVVR